MKKSEAISEIAPYTLIPYISPLEGMKTSEAESEIPHYTLFSTLVHLKKWMKTSEAVAEIAPLYPHSLH